MGVSVLRGAFHLGGFGPRGVLSWGVSPTSEVEGGFDLGGFDRGGFGPPFIPGMADPSVLPATGHKIIH